MLKLGVPYTTPEHRLEIYIPKLITITHMEEGLLEMMMKRGLGTS